MRDSDIRQTFVDCPAELEVYVIVAVDDVEEEAVLREPESAGFVADLSVDGEEGGKFEGLGDGYGVRFDRGVFPDGHAKLRWQSQEGGCGVHCELLVVGF